MAKSTVIWAAALMVGATSLSSPAQAAILSQESTLEKIEETQTLVADRGRGNRYCWHRYGRMRCRDRRDRFDNRWRDRRWRNRRRWENRRQWENWRRWRNRRRWGNRRRWENWRHRNDDWRHDDWRWRRGGKRGDYQDKLDRWLNRRNRDDD